MDTSKSFQANKIDYSKAESSWKVVHTTSDSYHDMKRNFAESVEESSSQQTVTPWVLIGTSRKHNESSTTLLPFDFNIQVGALQFQNDGDRFV